MGTKANMYTVISFKAILRGGDSSLYSTFLNLLIKSGMFTWGKIIEMVKLRF